MRLDANCFVEDRNNNLIECGEFKLQESPLETSNCMRDVFISGNITNIFNRNIVTSYGINDGEFSLSIINTNDAISIGSHYKEIDLCNIMGVGEVDVFTIHVISVWRRNSSSPPIQCKEEHRKFTLMVEAISEHPSASPSEQLSDYPSITPSSPLSGYPSSHPTESLSGYPSKNPTGAPLQSTLIPTKNESPIGIPNGQKSE